MVNAEVKTEGLSADIEDTDDCAAYRTTWQQPVVAAAEAQQDAIEGRLRHATEDARCEGTDRNLAHGIVLFPEGDNHDRAHNAEAGEVPRAHRTLNEVVAVGRDVLNHDDIQRPVQAHRNEERVQQRNDNSQDERRETIDLVQDPGNAIAYANAERAEQEGRCRNHNEQGEERHEDHMNCTRDDLL